MADLAGVNGDRKDFKVVGKPNLPGKLSYSLATGKAKFGSDYVFPNMLFAKFLRSPYANAMVKSVDVAAAKKIPGVVDVLTWEDDDLKNFGRRGGGMPGGGAPKPAAGGGAPKSPLRVLPARHSALRPRVLARGPLKRMQPPRRPPQKRSKAAGDGDSADLRARTSTK